MKRKKLIYITAGITLFIVFVWWGYSKTENTIESVCGNYTTYVLAKYSETETGIDFDGNLYTDTDYWSEEVTDTWQVESINNKATHWTCPDGMVTGITCQVPKVTYDHIERNFDGYRTIKDLNLFAILLNTERVDISTEDYDLFLKTGESVVHIKRFFGHPFSTSIIH